MENTNRFIIRMFFPYCIGKVNNKKYDLKAGLGVFAVADAISELDINNDYSKKGSWFQEFCEELSKEIPILSPAEAEKLSTREIIFKEMVKENSGHNQHSASLAILPKEQKVNTRKEVST